jgi:bacillithiol system protein YtxJ
MHWIHLTDEDQLNHLITKSQEKPQVIFQHSTPCCITETAKLSLPDIEKVECVDCYFLDLKVYLNISKKVDEIFHVYHHCPEVLIIKDGLCYCNETSKGASLNEIMKEKNLN